MSQTSRRFPALCPDGRIRSVTISGSFNLTRQRLAQQRDPSHVIRVHSSLDSVPGMYTDDGKQAKWEPRDLRADESPQFTPPIRLPR